MSYLKLSRRNNKNYQNDPKRIEKLNRNARPNELKSIEKAKVEKDKEYKTVVLTKEGLQDLEPETEIEFDDKGFEDNEDEISDSKD